MTNKQLYCDDILSQHRLSPSEHLTSFTEDTLRDLSWRSGGCFPLELRRSAFPRPHYRRTSHGIRLSWVAPFGALSPSDATPVRLLGAVPKSFLRRNRPLLGIGGLSLKPTVHRLCSRHPGSAAGPNFSTSPFT